LLQVLVKILRFFPETAMTFAGIDALDFDALVKFQIPGEVWLLETGNPQIYL
jgi:hypothetical protein